MANVAAPFGFALRKHPTGISRANAYTITNSYNTAIGYGDAVTLNTDGTLNLGPAGTTDLIGIFAGVQYNDATGKPTISKNWPGAVTGATNIVAYVYDDPDEVYEVQVSGAASTYVQTAIGAQADLVAGTVNAATGQSTMSLNLTLKAAAAQGQFRIIGFGPEGIYDATNNTIPTVLVQIAQHVYVVNKAAI
jgi:hypothetical protein